MASRRRSGDSRKIPDLARTCLTLQLPTFAMPTKPYGKTVVGVVAVCWSPTSHDRQQPAPPGLSRQPRNGFDSTPEPPRVSWRLWPPDLVCEFTRAGQISCGGRLPLLPTWSGMARSPRSSPRDLPAQRRLAHRLPEAHRAPRRTRWSWRGRAGAGLDAMGLAWTRSLARRARTSCEFPGPADSSGSRRTSAPQTSSSRPRISPNSTARCRAHQRVTPLHARHRDRDDLPSAGLGGGGNAAGHQRAGGSPGAGCPAARHPVTADRRLCPEVMTYTPPLMAGWAR
jgi:hypothetical protein